MTRHSKTLLERALEIKRTKKSGRATEEEIEVAIAWIEDKVTTLQASQVLGFKTPSAALWRLTVILKEAYNRGKLIKNL